MYLKSLRKLKAENRSQTKRFFFYVLYSRHAYNHKSHRFYLDVVKEFSVRLKQKLILRVWRVIKDIKTLSLSHYHLRTPLSFDFD